VTAYVPLAVRGVDCSSPAGSRPVVLRPDSALLRCARGSEQSGSDLGAQFPVVVCAIERQQRTNPFTSSPELLQESARHFADHCASCHGNDGRGNTEMGRNLYPRAPDMRLGDTQKLSDGELYDIIHDGVRWTGMPAWGEAANDNDQDSWKLVLFIRHLPNLSAEEIRDMERFNPKSDSERDEEKEEQEFLNGGPAGDSTRKPQ